MDTRIVSAPGKFSKTPLKPAGQLIFDKLHTAQKNSVALCEIKTGTTCTFGEVLTTSVTLATNLRGSFQIGKNTNITIISENSHKFCIAALAGLYLAAPIHLLNPGYTSYELKKFLTMSRPKLVFCSGQCAEKVNSLKEEFSFVETVVVFDSKGSTVAYDDLVKNGASSDFEFEDIGDLAEHVAYICNSSGTTGLPKGVMVPHENIRLNFSHFEDDELYPLAPQNCIIQVAPFFHVHGFNNFICAIYSGVKILIMDQFEPKLYLESIQDFGVNKLIIVPSLGNFLATSPLVDDYDLSSVEELYLAAGGLSKESEKTILEKFKLKYIRHTYGLSELACGVIMSPVGGGKPGSCGKLTPGHEAKIVNPETGQVLGANQPGEICLKGGAMKGYINDPVKTRETIDSNGFVHTGDLGYYDEDFDFFVIDRLKDLIKYKSFQVAPLEIEQILLQHHGVKDVAVVGKPDDRFGELPVAFVVQRERAQVGESEILEHVRKYVCVEKQLHGGVRFVEEIPRNAIGKILRKQLRDML
ncbi:unnamed protein product [Tenebrio molitor]|nr:unnamed protein product [Tenebrio molitor]